MLLGPSTPYYDLKDPWHWRHSADSRRPRRREPFLHMFDHVHGRPPTGARAMSGRDSGSLLVIVPVAEASLSLAPRCSRA